MDESKQQRLRLGFDTRVRLEFRGSKTNSDAESLAHVENCGGLTGGGLYVGGLQ